MNIFIAVASYCDIYSLKFKFKFQTVSVDYKPNYNNLNKLSLKPQTSEQKKTFLSLVPGMHVCTFRCNITIDNEKFYSKN